MSKFKWRPLLRVAFWFVCISISIVVLSLLLAWLSPEVTSLIIGWYSSVSIGLSYLKFVVYLLVLAGLVFWHESLRFIVRGPGREKKVDYFNRHRVPITFVFIFIMIFDGVLPSFAGGL